MVAKVAKLSRVAAAVRDAEVVEKEAIAVRSAETEANQIAGTIRNVNPTKGTMNCVGCAIATDATLVGHPASALASGPWNMPEVMARYFPGVPGIPANGEKGLQTLMQSAGPGARGIVWGTRDGGQVGHAFNAVNQGGTIRFLDGQTGRTANLTGFNGFYWCRTN